MEVPEEVMPNAEADAISVNELRTRLREAEETLRAIRAGEVDAIVVQDDDGERVYTLRSAEQPYRALVEEMREGALILTLNGDILYANRHFASLVRLPTEEIVGRAVHRFISLGELSSIAQAENGTHCGHLIARGGERIPVQFSQTIAVSEGVERVNLIVTDLREILNARGDRDRAQRENRSKDEFLAMLGHELRNPLAAISTGVTLLRSGPAPERRAWIEEMISRQAGQLQRLVEDLVDISRITRGKIELRRERVTLRKVLEGAAAAVQDMMAQHGHRFEVSAPPHDVHLEADPARLEQMVVNLLTNAAKYTPDGGNVRLSAERVEEEVVIRCRDTGRGLSGDMLESIFEPFVQFEPSRGRSEEGLGMGLTLVRKLAEMHGGAVHATSGGLGQGCEFVLRLPALATPAREDRRDSADVRQPADAGRVRRVLLVDDNDDLAESMRLFLGDEGHEVTVAHDGASAILMASDKRPEIVLLDIGLPGMDGFAVAERLREMPELKQTRIIAISGYKISEEDQAVRARFDLFLTKPVVHKQLAELLQTGAGRAQGA